MVAHILNSIIKKDSSVRLQSKKGTPCMTARWHCGRHRNYNLQFHYGRGTGETPVATTHYPSHPQ
eukprot:2750006-Rhodomonas_salina.2